MIVCNCRRISESDVAGHIALKTPDLNACWVAVSTQISGKPPICKDGKGHCHEYGQSLVDTLHANRMEKNPA